MGIEKYRMETRQSHPQYNFETRPIPCPDGITRLVTLSEAMWNWFDDLIKRPNEPFDKTIDFCWGLAKTYKPDPFEAFTKILHYKIALHWRIENAKKDGKSIARAIYFNGFARGE